MYDVLPGVSKYDVLLGLSTYESPLACERLLRSIPKLQAKTLTCIAAPRERDIRFLEPVAKQLKHDILIFWQDMNNMYAGRDWGFVFAVNNGIKANFLMSLDDDIEFIDESREMMVLANFLRGFQPYSILGFDSSHPYKYPDVPYNDCWLKVGLDWLDGNVMITNWQDNLMAGLVDQPADVPIAFYTEMEYCHRMRYLTNRPIVLRGCKEYYLHHFREDPGVMRQRFAVWERRHSAGESFWKEKFGLDYGEPDLYERCCKIPEKFRSHVCFGGLWTDWKAIYDTYKDRHQLVFSNI